MYEVHYSDGADHKGVGTFELWHDAKRFADAVCSCGYAACIKNMAAPMIDKRKAWNVLNKADRLRRKH